MRRIPDKPALRRKIDLYNHRYISNFSRIFRAYGRHILRQVDRLWDRHAESFLIRADRAVILTTGGFINNRAMVNNYAPGFLGAMPLGNLGCNGSGIELGSTVGGATDKLGSVSALRAINPPEAFVQGIVVSPEGRRLTAEDCYQDKMGRHIIEDGGGKAYIILDKALYKKAFKQALPGPGKIFLVQCAPALMSLSFTAKTASSIEKLAEKCGMNPETLCTAVQQNNEVAFGKSEDLYKKDPRYNSGIVAPPFYAVDISIDRRTFPCPALTLGGLVIDEESGQVVHGSGRPIDKLYAAGRCAVGVPSNGYISGLSIADCVFSGRRAGQHSSK
jgi:3-oxo-5alpha-steroid 4-dehydrogenase